MPEIERPKLSAGEIARRKGGDRLVMLVTYDYPISRLAQRAGVDLILVGDSLGMTVLGLDSPVPVTVDDVLYHCRAVVRGAPRTHVVADLPFLSYHIDDGQALRNAGRLLQEGGADSVKLEGGSHAICGRVAALVAAGIPVMGHIGLTPQQGGTVGYGSQGTDLESAGRVLAEAKALADAGVYAIALEAIPDELAAIITERIPVPTVGVGAGPHCDGQSLVSTDLLGIESTLFLNFAKRYANLGVLIEDAFNRYASDVRTGTFPEASSAPPLSPDIVSTLRSSFRD